MDTLTLIATLIMEAQERDLLMWLSGFDYAMQRMAEAADDGGAFTELPTPTRTHEERVAERVAVFEQCAIDIYQEIGDEDWPDVETVHIDP